MATLLGKSQALISLKKGACVALEFDPDRKDQPAVFLWYMTPGKNRTMSFKKAFPQE